MELHAKRYNAKRHNAKWNTAHGGNKKGYGTRAETNTANLDPVNQEWAALELENGAAE